jgi:outer membrane protein assembly factor BamD (BamD/ComL family)
MPQSRTQTGPDSLVLETEMLDSARRALSSGRADRASAELDAYERRFPKGALAEEALRLRIEAARRAGDVATAKRLAQAFSRRYPKSAYAKRLETLLSSDRRAP